MSDRFLRHAPLLFVDFPGAESLKQIYGTFNRALLKVVPQLRNHADALADFVDAVRRMRVDGCSCPTCGPLSGALAALDQEAPA